MLVRVQESSASSVILGAAIRTSGASTSVVNAVLVGLSSFSGGTPVIRHLRYSGGNTSFIGTYGTTPSYSYDTLYWLTVTQTGTSTSTVLSAADDPVASSPLLSFVEADSGAPSTGGVGMGLISADEVDVFFVGIGTDGDTAPIPDYATIPVAFSGSVPAQTATVGTAFSLAMAGYFSGPSTPFTFSSVGSALPAGVTLNTATGALSGTPTTAGTYSDIVIRATDAQSNVANSNAFTITVASGSGGSGISVHEDFERSCVNPALSTVSTDTDGVDLILLHVRTQIVDTMHISPRWLEPVAKITGVNGKRPRFGFANYSEGFQTWGANQEAHYSYDGINWLPFVDTSVGSSVRFRLGTAFTQDTVYIARSWPRSVTQVGNQIAALASAHPTKIKPSATALAFTPSATTSFPAQAFIEAELAPAVDELGRAVPSVPVYAFTIDDDAFAGPKTICVINAGIHSGEDVGEVVFWELIDYIMGSSPAALALRQKFRILVHPLVNPKGRYAGYWRGSPDANTDPNRDWLTSSPLHDCVPIVKSSILAEVAGGYVGFAFDFHASPSGNGAMQLGINENKPAKLEFDTLCRAKYPGGDWVDYGGSRGPEGDGSTSVTTLGFYIRDLKPGLHMLVETCERFGSMNPTTTRPYAEAMVGALADMESGGWFGEAVPTAPTIVTSTLPGATVGIAYSQTLSASGDGPMTWTVVSGSLPTGLSLSGATISGTPTTVQTANFIVRAMNSVGSDTQELSMQVAAAAPPRKDEPTVLSRESWTSLLAQQSSQARAQAIADWAIDEIDFLDGFGDVIRTVTVDGWSVGAPVNGVYPAVPGEFDDPLTGSGEQVAAVFKSAGIEMFRVSCGVLPPEGTDLRVPQYLMHGHITAGVPVIRGDFAIYAPMSSDVGITFPVVVRDPIAVGLAEVGKSVDMTPGQYDGNPAPTITRQWYRRVGSGSTVAIPGATSLRYTLTSADLGAMISGREVAKNSFGEVIGYSNTIGPVVSESLTTLAPATIHVEQGGQVDLRQYVRGGKPPYTVTVGSGTLPTGATVANSTLSASGSASLTLSGPIVFNVADSDTAPARPAWVTSLPLKTWAQIPNTVMRNVMAPDPAGHNVNSTTAWCGAALKESGSEIFFTGGGHTDGSSNAVYSIKLNAASPQWVMRRTPTPLAQIVANASHYTDGRPTSRHTYWNIQYHQQRDLLMLFGGAAVYGNGNFSFPIIDAFDPATNDYLQAGTFPNYPGTILAGMTAAQSPAGDVWLSHTNGDLYVWRTAMGTHGAWTKLATQPSFAIDSPSVYDPVRERIVRFHTTTRSINPNTGASSTVSLTGPEAARITRQAQAIHVPELDCYLFVRFGTSTTSGPMQILNVDPSTWEVTAFGELGTPPSLGTSNYFYARFMYVPELKCIVFMHSVGLNLYVLRVA
jgi:hypothetical protein